MRSSGPSPHVATSAPAKHKTPQGARFLLRRMAAWLGLGLGLLTAGCAHVEPWERGKLADYTMRADRDPLYDAFMEHTFFSREAASGGRGVGGGGCGCN